MTIVLKTPVNITIFLDIWNRWVFKVFVIEFTQNSQVTSLKKKKKSQVNQSNYTFHFTYHNLDLIAWLGMMWSILWWRLDLHYCSVHKEYSLLLFTKRILTITPLYQFSSKNPPKFGIWCVKVVLAESAEFFVCIQKMHRYYFE